MSKPDDYDLGAMLGAITESIKNIEKSTKAMVDWQEAHDKNDKEEFRLVHSRISRMKAFALPLSIVSAFVGYISNRFIG